MAIVIIIAIGVFVVQDFQAQTNGIRTNLSGLEFTDNNIAERVSNLALVKVSRNEFNDLSNMVDEEAENLDNLDSRVDMLADFVSQETLDQNDLETRLEVVETDLIGLESDLNTVRDDLNIASTNIGVLMIRQASICVSLRAVVQRFLQFGINMPIPNC